ncbi:MAG: ABC transporter ATP-binding protein/permease [Longimicrobiales bacterium]|nr:ABC transporter ATP-binding protein/permease [Longimicrobiales bacterium]
MNQLKTVLPWVRPYRKEMALGLLMVVISNLFTIAGPYLMKLAIDGLGDPGVTSGRVGSYAGLIVLAALLGGAAKFGMRQIMNSASRRVECDLRDDYFNHLLELDASFFATTRTGDLMSRATNDTLAVRMATGPAVMYAVNTLVSFAFSLALMLWISPRLTLVALIPMLVLPPIVIGFGKIIHSRFEEIQEQLAALSTMVQENLTGLRIVRAYVQEKEQEAEFDLLNADYMSKNMGLIKASGSFFPLLMLVAGLAMVVALWFGGIQVIEGRITVGDFVAFNFYLALLTWPMIALGWVVNLFQRGDASMGRLNQILQAEAKVSPPEHPSPLPDLRGEIEFRNVGFRYPGSEREILKEVSFLARAGETVAIVGPTGSGKSTLVSLIPRIYDPTGGEILLDGTPLTNLDPKELRQVIGVVPQDSFLFSETIRDNIALGIDLGEESAGSGTQDQEKDTPEVAAAKVAQIHESILSFPKGYSTLLGERGINLSGGQKQRTTLARALARDPFVLILDDALSAVDTHTEAKILEDLKTVLAGRTSFIISHRVSAVMNADQILVLDGGRVVERGTHAALLARGGTYTDLLRRQMLEEELEEEEKEEEAVSLRSGS